MKQAKIRIKGKEIGETITESQMDNKGWLTLTTISGDLWIIFPGCFEVKEVFDDEDGDVPF